MSLRGNGFDLVNLELVVLPRPHPEERHQCWVYPTLAILGAQVGYSRLGWRVSKDGPRGAAYGSRRSLRDLLTMRPIENGRVSR